MAEKIPVRETTNWDSFPSRLRRSTLHPEVTFRRRPGWFASLGATTPPPPGATVLDAGDADLDPITLHQGEPGPRVTAGGARVVPVYESTEGGTVGVPTGRIFVRFEPAARAADRRELLEQLGLRIVQVPRYAPQSVWVEDVMGRIDRALGRVKDLEALDGVENVEPQLLSPKAARPDPTPAPTIPRGKPGK